jgi:tetratricopeptide (TPR) repeat protein
MEVLMRRASFLLLLSLAAISLKTLAAQETVPQSAAEYFQQGWVYYQAGEMDAAIENFEAAKRLEPDMYPILEGLGHAYFSRGNYDAAIENYTQTIQIRRDLDEEDPLVYASRGGAYFNMGNYDSAIADFSQAIRLNVEEPFYWNNRGEIYRNKGDYDRAIDDFSKAIELNDQYTDAWNNLGLAYYGKGEYDNAIENFTTVIEIDEHHAHAWNNRGGAYLEKGEYDKAIADFSQVLAFDTDYEYAIVYSNRSRAYRSKKEYTKALKDCESALEINPNFTPVINNRAYTCREMGEYQKALDYYRECLEKTQQSINIHDVSVYAWYLAGQVYKEFPYLKGDIKAHKFWSEFAGRSLSLDGISKGISNAEKIRQNMGVQGAHLMTQMIYLYYAGVDFEVTLGSPENAFLYSESLRSRGFLEQLGAEAAIRLKEVTENERTRFTELRAVIEEQQAIINTYNREKLEGEANDRYTAAFQRSKEAEEALAELDKTIGSRIPKYAELRNPKLATLDEVMAYCGEDRAVLEYVLWDDSAYKPIKGYESWDLKGDMPAINSYCLVITKAGLTAVPLEPGFNYAATIKRLRSNINSLKRYYASAREGLYNQLIKPVLHYLQNVKNITIVPDGELAIIPFDMLGEDPDPDSEIEFESKMFGEDYAISLSPSISVSILAQKKGEVQYSSIMFFANDEFQGKVYPDGKHWDNLPGVEEEIKILKDLVERLNMDTTSYFRNNATKEQIQQLSSKAELQKYNIIHFACHGFFNKENPSESGLALYQIDNDGYLTIPDIASLDLDSRIVVLSACETGLAEPRLGEGMVGMVRAFMVAGAENVGVSLWEIDDRSATLFMESLYRKVLEEGKSFREAYKEVKMAFQQEDDLSSPSHWAAFIMYE